MIRKETKQVFVGSVPIGGKAPIVVQTMTDTDTRDVEATVDQIKRVEELGCEIVRVAVVDKEAAKAIGKIKNRISIPLVADIHFEYELALEAVAQGIDKVRINPGNIGSESKIKAVVDACKSSKIPIRIGVNVGSLEKDLEKTYGQTPQAAVESCMRHVKILERYKFNDILISVKFSDVPQMIEAYRMLSNRVNYPLHLGVTHAGTNFMGSMKNAIGIGSLLYGGIGDTLRVSLTAPPEEEIKVCWAILKALKLRKHGLELISCPVCGRAGIDVSTLAEKVEIALSRIKSSITVAVMGCVVNGPNEAKGADIGIAGIQATEGKVGRGALFKDRKVIDNNIPENELFTRLITEIELMTGEKIPI